MALTKVNKTVADLPNLSQSLILETVTGGIKSYIDTGLSSKSDVSHTHSIYAPINNPSFTGNPLAPTQSQGNRTTRIATTAFVGSEVDALNIALTAYVDTKVIGLNQTWQDVSISRILGTTYQNTTIKPIMVAITLGGFNSSSSVYIEISANGSSWVVFDIKGETETDTDSFIVPPNHYYRARLAAGTATITRWNELR